MRGQAALERKGRVATSRPFVSIPSQLAPPALQTQIKQPNSLEQCKAASNLNNPPNWSCHRRPFIALIVLQLPPPPRE